MNDQDTNNQEPSIKNSPKKARPKTSGTPGSDQGRADSGRDKHPGGRPTDYTVEIVGKVKQYLADCIDEPYQLIKTEGDKSTSYENKIKVKLPTIEGLAVYLGISRDTVYEWEKALNEDGSRRYPEFSDTLEQLRVIQAEKLLNNGLSGDYNPLIAKLILSANHGMKEKSEIDHNNPDGNLKTIIINKSENSNHKPTA